MSDSHSGGCSCGEVRYETTGEPVWLGFCHCKKCQRRTGSAFGFSVYFSKENVKILSGNLTKYRSTSDAGRWGEREFCATCGTSVTWTLELNESIRGIAGGTFDDTSRLKPKLHVWMESDQGWFRYPDDAELHDKQPF